MTDQQPIMCGLGSKCVGGGRPAIPNTTVCQSCASALRHALRDLRDLWPDLTHGVARDRNSAPTTGRVQNSRIADLGDYWRPQVTGVLTDVRQWLHFLADMTIDSPALAGYAPELLGTEKLLLLYAQHARPLVVTHPEIAVGTVKQALRLRARAWASLNSSWVRRIPLPGRTCLEDVEHGDPDEEGSYYAARCGGDLVAILQPAETGGDSAIVCSRYPREHRVRPDQWDALAEQLDAITEGSAA